MPGQVIDNRQNMRPMQDVDSPGLQSVLGRPACQTTELTNSLEKRLDDWPPRSRKAIDPV